VGENLLWKNRLLLTPHSGMVYSSIKFCTVVPVLNFQFGDVRSVVAFKRLMKRCHLSDFLYF